VVVILLNQFKVCPVIDNWHTRLSCCDTISPFYIKIRAYVLFVYFVKVFELLTFLQICIYTIRGRWFFCLNCSKSFKSFLPLSGGSKIFGVFRVKNHDFTPKNHIFSNCGGRRENCWDISYEKSRFYAKNHTIVK
jgi:hypothetical protein